MRQRRSFRQAGSKGNQIPEPRRVAPGAVRALVTVRQLELGSGEDFEVQGRGQLAALVAEPRARHSRPGGRRPILPVAFCVS